MTNTIRVVLGLTLCLAFASPAAVARAKQPPPATAKSTSSPSAAKRGIGKGDKELGFFLTYDNYNDTQTNLLTLGVVFGTYLRDTLELRVTPVVLYVDSGGFSLFGFNPYVTLEKQFPNGSAVVPYVGGGIGFTIDFGSGGGTTISDLGIFVTPTAGLKFFMGERMSLEYGLGYQYGTDYQCVDAAGFSTCNSGTKSTLKNDLRFNVYF